MVRLAVLSRERRPRIGRMGGLAIGVAVGGLAAGAVAIASPDAPNTTDVHFVQLTTPKVLATNAYLGPTATLSYLVAGGTSTVPSDATTIDLTVVATGNTSGTLNVYPMDSAGRGVTVPYTLEGLNNDVPMNVGINDKIAFTNNAAKASKLTVKIVGYSTQVTADAINGSGGSDGQVLTNTGNGAAEWRNVPSSGGGSASGPDVHWFRFLGTGALADSSDDRSTLTLSGNEYYVLIKSSNYNIMDCAAQVQQQFSTTTAAPPIYKADQSHGSLYIHGYNAATGENRPHEPISVTIACPRAQP
jgi:hypothetical protein